MDVGQRIKKLREDNNLTQEELGEIINSTKQAIFKYESGIVTNIPISKIKSLADCFGVSPSYLMGWTENNNDCQKRNLDIAEEKLLITQIKKKYGTSAFQALELYTQLDSDDQGEIRGEMKQMLKAEKYLVKKESNYA